MPASKTTKSATVESALDDEAYVAFVERESDSAEDLLAKRAAADPSIITLIAAAREERRLMRDLAAARKVAVLTQTQVAERMRTSQGLVSRLESGAVDPQHSTEDRWADAIGYRIERRLVPKSLPAYAMAESIPQRKRQKV